MKNTVSYFLIGLSLIACKSENNDELETAKMMYHQNVEEIREGYQYISKTISDAGNREKDLNLLYKIDSIQLLRRLAGLKYDNSGDQLELHHERILNFIEKLVEQIDDQDLKKQTNGLVPRCQHFLTEFEKSKSKLPQFYFLVNISQIEKLFLEQYQRTMSGDCWSYFFINFNLHTNADTVELNTPIKMMIALKPDITETLWEIKIDSVMITRNDSVIRDSFKFEKVGGIGYVEYSPKIPGIYKVSGNYEMTYKTEDYTEKETFIKSFTVFRKDL